MCFTFPWKFLPPPLLKHTKQLNSSSWTANRPTAIAVWSITTIRAFINHSDKEVSFRTRWFSLFSRFSIVSQTSKAFLCPVRSYGGRACWESFSPTSHNIDQLLTLWNPHAGVVVQGMTGMMFRMAAALQTMCRWKLSQFMYVLTWGKDILVIASFECCLFGATSKTPSHSRRRIWVFTLICVT